MNEAIRSGGLRRRKAFDAGGGPVRVVADTDAVVRLLVVDNWPDQAPIGSHELDVLETFLAVALDEILGGKHVGK